MRPLILIPCTDRKRISPEDSLRASSLSRGSASEVAKEWGDRIQRSRVRAVSREIYCGRSFKEANGAAEELQAELMIVSAGLGLVRQNDEIPGYSLTVSKGHCDSIEGRITDPNFSPSLWWNALGSNTSAVTSLGDTLRDTSASLVLVSLSASYARMLSDELSGLEEGLLRRLRLFGAGLVGSLPSQIAETIMPYDARLNGDDSPVRGTMSDFGSRAIRHYANCLQSALVDGSSIANDRLALLQIMNNWSIPKAPKRAHLSDDQVVKFILKNWEASGGRSGFTLRLLRDSGLACEQGRFKDLFYQARKLRTNSESKIT